MRRALMLPLVAAFALATTSLAAQTPASTPPQPAAPPSDAKATRESPVYLVLSLDVHAARLITGESGNGDQTSPGMGSLDFSIQSARKSGAGLAIRSIGGEDAYEFTEIAILFGSRRFSVDAGAASRTGYNELTDNLNDTTYRFARVGARSRLNLGNSDFSVTLRGAGYIRIPTPEEEALPSKLTGFSLESGLSWTWAKYPVTANLGYRLEKFNVFGVEQETSSLIIGGGILLGRRGMREPTRADIAAPVRTGN